MQKQKIVQKNDFLFLQIQLDFKVSVLFVVRLRTYMSADSNKGIYHL